MSDEIYNDVLSIKDDLLSLDISKTYFSIIENIKNNKELQNFLRGREFYKQKMVVAESKNNEKKYFKFKNKYEHYETLINNHPLIINYKSIKKEILTLTEEIKDILAL